MIYRIYTEMTTVKCIDYIEKLPLIIRVNRIRPCLHGRRVRQKQNLSPLKENLFTLNEEHSVEDSIVRRLGLHLSLTFRAVLSMIKRKCNIFLHYYPFNQYFKKREKSILSSCFIL